LQKINKVLYNINKVRVELETDRILVDQIASVKKGREYLY